MEKERERERERERDAPVPVDLVERVHLSLHLLPFEVQNHFNPNAEP